MAHAGGRSHRGAFGFFRDLRTAQKLLSGFVLVCLLLVGVGVFGLSSLSAAHDRMNGLYQDELLPIAYLGEVDADLRQSEGLVFRMATAHPDDRPGVLTEIRDTDATLDEAFASYTATDMTGREKARDGFAAGLTAWRQVRDSALLPLAQAGRIEDLQTAVEDQATAPFGQADTNIDALKTIEEASGQAVLDDSVAAYASSRNLTYGVIVGAVALALGLAWGLARLISRPLRQAVTVLQAMAEGRLDQDLDVDSPRRGRPDGRRARTPPSPRCATPCPRSAPTPRPWPPRRRSCPRCRRR